MDAVGAHQYWAFSPAHDVQEIYHAGLSRRRGASDDDAAVVDDKRPLSVLLIMPGDVCTVIKSVAQRFRTSRRPLHFYVFDKPVEVLARHLLLLQLACDWEVPVRQRGNVFLEVLGNCQVQHRTSLYLSNKRLQLVDLLGNQRGVLATVADFSRLRFKQRDELEFTFKTWDHRIEYDVHDLRDHRLRHHFGTRYDFRNNLIDWDYHATIKAAAGVVHYVHYRGWRNTGIAFEFGDQTYTTPNRSMASYVEGKERGRGSTMRRGFWTDVVVSPYHSVGTAANVNDDNAKELFDIHNRRTGSEQYRHTAVEIAAFNVLAWLHEMETGKRYRMAVPHDPCSGLGAVAAAAAAAAAAAPPSKPPSPPTTSGGPSPTDGDDSTGGGGVEETKAPPASGTDGGTHGSSTPGVGPTPSAGSAGDGAGAGGASAAGAGATTGDVPPDVLAGAVQRAKHIVRTMAGVKVFPVTGDFPDVVRKLGRVVQFDYVSASCHAAQHVAGDAFCAALADTAVVSVETARNVVDIKAPQQTLFAQHVVKLAGDIGAEFVGSARALSSDTFAKGTVLLSGRQQADLDAAAKKRSQQLAAAKALSTGLKASDDAKATALHLHRAAVMAANEDTAGGDTPKAQRLVFVWRRGAADARREAFQQLWQANDPSQPVREALKAATKAAAARTVPASAVPAAAPPAPAAAT